MATRPGETMPAMSSRRSRSTPWTLIVVGGVGIVIVAGFLILRARSPEPTADPSLAGSGSAVSELQALLDSPAGSATSAVDPSKSHVLSKTSLGDAIEAARPLMSNTIGRLDVGSALLAMWASKNLSWQALDALPETTPALYKRDPDSERGHKFCLAGTVLEIRAEKTLSNRLVEDKAIPLIDHSSNNQGDNSGGPSYYRGEQGTSYSGADSLATASPSASANSDILLLQGMDFTIPDGGKVYFATIQSKPEAMPEGSKQKLAPRDATFVEIIAVRSSGNIVDGSDARVCGILTGVTVPPSGSTTPAGLDSATLHRIVGMFDLPQNRVAPETQAQHG